MIPNNRITSSRRPRRAGIAALAASLALAGCISFGAKPPPMLLTLTADQAPAAGNPVTGNAATAVILDLPSAERKLDNNRVPVQVSESEVAYVPEAFWVDKPTRLFRSMLADTISARTGRLVLPQAEAGGVYGVRLSGQLVDFGYDAAAAEVVVTFDAQRRIEGQPLQQRRFTARRPLGELTPANVGRELNRAANSVAGEIADWVGAAATAG